VLAAHTVAVAVAEGALSVDQNTTLTLTYPLLIEPQTVVVQSPGSAACALQWAPTAISLTVRLRFGRGALNDVEISLVEPAKIDFGGSALVDPAGCLAAVGGSAGGPITAHLEAAVVTAITTPYVQHARSAVATVLPPLWEHRAQVTVDGGAIRWQFAYRSPPGLPPDRLISHNGTYLHAHLDAGFDADRHLCAVDALPPIGAISPLVTHPPKEPQGPAVLRRVLVVEPPTIARLVWALHRSGLFCRGRAQGLEARLDGYWAADLSPKLAGLVQPGPISARFWPGGVPTARVVELSGSASIELHFPDALLEIAAPVEGVEVVVIRARGQLRTRVALNGVGGAWSLEVADASFESVAIDSPIASLGGLAGAEIEKTVFAVVSGIFDGPVVLPANVPALAHADQVGESLWLWLDGGVFGEP
jgi:hypothetical protein